jgi:hypothetical protein
MKMEAELKEEGSSKKRLNGDWFVTVTNSMVPIALFFPFRCPLLDGCCSVFRIVDALTESRNWARPTSERTSMSQDGKVG